MNGKIKLAAALLVLLITACHLRAEKADFPQETPITAAPRTDGQPKTFYIRLDGGSEKECTGEANQPYPGEGIGQDCAWDHLFRALPPGSPPRIQGGDTLIIHPGSYPMGLDAIRG